MKDVRSILILLFLLPAVSVAQTVHVEKDKILYKGKIRIHSGGDTYSQSKNILLNYVSADSLKEDKDNKELSSVAVVKLPSPHHLEKFLSYKVKMEPTNDGFEYEIKDVELILHERGEKIKRLSSEELLKGMQESGNSSRDTEKQLNEIDMYIEKFIAVMRSFSANGNP
jgi:hypothetical protein